MIGCPLDYSLSIHRHRLQSVRFCRPTVVLHRISPEAPRATQEEQIAGVLGQKGTGASNAQERGEVAAHGGPTSKAKKAAKTGPAAQQMAKGQHASTSHKGGSARPKKTQRQDQALQPDSSRRKSLQYKESPSHTGSSMAARSALAAQAPAPATAAQQQPPALMAQAVMPPADAASQRDTYKKPMLTGQVVSLGSSDSLDFLLALGLEREVAREVLSRAAGLARASGTTLSSAESTITAWQVESCPMRCSTPIQPDMRALGMHLQ